MVSRTSDYAVSPELQTRIENGLAEDWEVPFVCDECGVFQQGGELDNPVSSACDKLICSGCSGRMEDERERLLDASADAVAKLIP